MKKRKIKAGYTVKTKNHEMLRMQELFVADGVRWVRCTKVRKTGAVKYNGRKNNYIDTENVYLTDTEWLKLLKSESH